jgi:hypothetical protein
MDDVSNLAKVLQRLIHEGCNVTATGWIWGCPPWFLDQSHRGISPTEMEIQSEFIGFHEISWKIIGHIRFRMAI